MLPNRGWKNKIVWFPIAKLLLAFIIVDRYEEHDQDGGSMITGMLWHSGFPLRAFGPSAWYWWCLVTGSTMCKNAWYMYVIMCIEGTYTISNYLKQLLGVKRAVGSKQHCEKRLQQLTQILKDFSPEALFMDLKAHTLCQKGLLFSQCSCNFYFDDQLNWVQIFTKWEYWSLTITNGVQCLQHSIHCIL